MRSTYIEIDLNGLKYNLNQIRKHTKNKPIMAVVKANAYGHGLQPIAHFYEKQGVSCLGVAMLEEAVQLRKAGITIPIVVFGGLQAEQLSDYLNWKLEFFVPSLALLKATEIIAEEKNIRAQVHLKLDTGMGRIGALISEADALLEEAICSENIDIKGVCSHLACADDPNDKMTLRQLEQFHEAISIFERLGAEMPPRHLANSGGVLYFPETHLDMVRPGILLYGVYPSAASPRVLDVKTAISVKSKISFSKSIPENYSVSYGATWKSVNATNILTIPIGYGDGYRRNLSDKGEVLLNKKRYPIVGRICMDQLMIDVGSDSIELGEEVILIGKQGKENIKIEDISAKAETIPYEILTGLSTRLPRTYKQIV